MQTVDGRNFTLLADVYYTGADGVRYCVPAGATSDGASTPAAVWPLLPPFGLYWPAAYLHDAAYRNSLLAWNGAAWLPAALSKEKCDALLLEAMQSLGVPDIEAGTIYDAVVMAGRTSFEKDRAV